MKRILILTVSYGEGHNSAARGVRDGLSCVTPASQVEVHDLFAETFGWFNELIRTLYLTLINWKPTAWGPVYRWLDNKASFERDFARFALVKKRLRDLLSRFQPDIVVSVFPAYPYLLEQTWGADRRCQSIVVITDSITVNRIWYRCTADYFLPPNEQSAAVVRAGGVPSQRIRIFGFPVSPKFAQLRHNRPMPSTECRPRVLYMINAGTRRAPEQLQRLLALDVKLTVTVGRDQRLRRRIESAAAGKPVKILGWTDELPRLLNENHVLIGKAGGATVQEAIAARCPMIINHIVSGQEEGNAQLIKETNSGTTAHSPGEVANRIEQAFADGARLWREWHSNISHLSRPRAALDTAEFLLSL